MKSGIILEIDASFLTVLTPDGEFLRARNENLQYQLGQEIEFTPIELETKKPYLLSKWRSSIKTKALAAAALVILVGGSTLIPVYKSNQVYAYMSIDDKSNIELGVNEKLQVIEIQTYNRRGEAIVKKIGDWKKEDLSTVSINILKEMKKQNLMDDEVVFSSTIKIKDDKETNKQFSDEISHIIKQADQQNAKLIVVNGTNEERKAASKQGVTLGQFKHPDTDKKTKKSKGKQNQQNATAIVEDPIKEQKEIDSQNSNQVQPSPPATVPNENIPPGNGHNSKNLETETGKQIHNSAPESKQIKKQELTQKKIKKQENKK